MIQQEAEKKQHLTLTVLEAAEELRKTERAVRQLIWRKKLPVKRLGKSVVIVRADFVKFLNELPSA